MHIQKDIRLRYKITWNGGGGGGEGRGGGWVNQLYAYANKLITCIHVLTSVG